MGGGVRRTTDLALTRTHRWDRPSRTRVADALEGPDLCRRHLAGALVFFELEADALIFFQGG